MHRLLFFIAFLFACRRKTIQVRGYEIEGPKSDWKDVNSGSADHAWYNPKIGSTIYVTSNCGAKFHDRSLHDAVYSMTAGIRSEIEPIERKLFLDGREALMLQSKGRLDGVNVQMAVVALSKNRCLYDFVYIARPENFADGFGDFHQMLHTFETRTSRRDVLTNDPQKASE
jgi:hypothetical protein